LLSLLKGGMWILGRWNAAVPLRRTGKQQPAHGEEKEQGFAGKGASGKKDSRSLLCCGEFDEAKGYPKNAVKACRCREIPATVRSVREPSPTVTTMQVSDPEMLVAGIRGANLQPCQISARPAPSELSRMLCPGVCLDLANLGPAMLFAGAMPADCFTLIFVRACPEVGHSFNFATEHTDGYMGFFPPGGLLDAATPAGYRNATLTVSVAAFHAALATYFPDAPARLLAEGAGMRIAPKEQARLRVLLGVLERAMWDPARPLASKAARQRAGRDLLAAFFAALRSGCADLVEPPAPRTAARHRRLRQAREYLAEHLHQPVYLDDLCAVIGLNHRAVENLFRDFLGVTPNIYLRHLRLHGVRRTLRRKVSSPGAVKHAALEWGFWHQGHFARDYRMLFGESPGATLIRA
jgi:AraC-like DNA-binding protein